MSRNKSQKNQPTVSPVAKDEAITEAAIAAALAPADVAPIVRPIDDLEAAIAAIEGSPDAEFVIPSEAIGDQGFSSVGDSMTGDPVATPEQRKAWMDFNIMRLPPEITLADVFPKLPVSGKIDVIGISGELKCTAQHIRHLLEGAPGVSEHGDHTWWMPDNKSVYTPTVKPMDTLVENQLDGIRGLIANLSPEAKEEAIKLGMLPKPKFVKRPNVVASGDPVPAKVRAPKKAKEVHTCACGCGGECFGSFKMGHDARSKGLLQRLSLGKLAQNELGWTPNADLAAYVKAHPDWDLKFGHLFAPIENPTAQEVEIENTLQDAKGIIEDMDEEEAELRDLLDEEANEVSDSGI